MEATSLSTKETVEKLVATLQELPNVHAQSSPTRAHGPRAEFDAQIDLSVANRHYTLLVEVKKSLFPRDVRQVLWQLQHYVHAIGPNQKLIPMLVAESISPGSKELLRQEKVGYFDTGGSLFIPAEGAYVYIDKPAPKSLAKSVRTLFQGKRAQVLHALLHRPKAWVNVKELAKIAHVSPATASETLTALERFDWFESRGQGPSKERQLTAPRSLLDEWKKQVLAGPKLSCRSYYVPTASHSDKLIDRLDHACEKHRVEYALTQEAGAQRYAPFLSAISRISCRIAPGRAIEKAAEELDAREVTEGANLTIIETRSESAFLFKERIDSTWVANPVQVYLDLLLASGRSQEMAEHLRHERIGF